MLAVSRLHTIYTLPPSTSSASGLAMIAFANGFIDFFTPAVPLGGLKRPSLVIKIRKKEKPLHPNQASRILPLDRRPLRLTTAQLPSRLARTSGRWG